MRRSTVLVQVSAAVLLVACSRPLAPPSPEDNAFSRNVPLASVENGATSSTLALHFIRSNECSDEDVEITGVIHFVSYTQPDGSVIGHFNYQGVTGTGLTSGTQYRVSAVDHVRLSAPFPSSVQSVRSFRLIGPGPGDNLLVTALFHITVTANGEVSVSVNELRTSCPDGTV